MRPVSCVIPPPSTTSKLPRSPHDVRCEHVVECRGRHLKLLTRCCPSLVSEAGSAYSSSSHASYDATTTFKPPRLPPQSDASMLRNATAGLQIPDTWSKSLVGSGAGGLTVDVLCSLWRRRAKARFSLAASSHGRFQICGEGAISLAVIRGWPHALVGHAFTSWDATDVVAKTVVHAA